jgi:O-glycosyl hydrolase
MIFAAAALVGVGLCTGLRSFKTTIGTPKPPGRIFVLALALVSALVPLGAHAQTQVITLNGNGTGRTFDGVGAVSAGASSRLLIDYPEPYRSQILDFLFEPHFGASLQSLKVEIGGDVDSSGGAEPSHMRSPSDANFTRGYEGWLMNEAKRRNPNIQLGALAWGAPGWLGGGQFYSQDTIDYIVAFLSGIKATYGFDINYVGIWNETPYNTAWIKGLKDAILAAGLPTRIVAADQNVGQWGIVDDMLADPALMAAVDIIGEHYVQNFSTDAAQSLGKPLWDSEDGPWRGDWTGAAAIAQLLNRNYISGKLTKTEIWSPVTSYYDIMTLSGSGLMRANTPWSGNYEVQPAIWAMAHTAQFADPGWRYIDQSSGLFNGSSYVTLRNGSNYSVIVETLGETANRQVRFQITGGLSQGTVRVWRSNATSQFVRLADITPSGGSFTVTLAPRAIYSFTTTNVQTKGNATPPAPFSFPIPYQDDFESYPFEKSPKYLSDINGAFETTACGGGRPGRCLQQLITTPPIPWLYAGPSEPASVLGDTSLGDYAVSADVMFEQAGYVKLVGRLLSKEQVSGTMNAYQFSLRNSGEWSLRITDSIAIASGSIGAMPLNTWHAVRLVLNGSQIEAFVDGIPIVSVMDQTYSIGLAGIGVRGFTRHSSTISASTWSGLPRHHRQSRFRRRR